MNYSVLIGSILVGVILGIGYGITFFRFGGISSVDKESLSVTQQKKYGHTFLKTTLRVLVLGIFLAYILPAKQLNTILVLISFCVSFWAVILKEKATNYE